MSPTTEPRRPDYDVIVVGARVAGSPTAMLLARQGYRVLLIDRMRFPSDMMSSHYIHAYGLAKLNKWGLLDPLIATGCPPIRLLASDWGDIQLAGTAPPNEGIDFGLCPRRKYLDYLLLNAAIAAGVEFEEATAVTSLLFDGDRVVGVQKRHSGGSKVSVTARWVVGADGMRSTVASAVAAPEYNVVPSLTTTYLTYWENLPMDRLLIHWRTGRCVPAIPTHDDLTVILTGWPYAEWQRFRSDIEGNYVDTVLKNGSPELVERFRDARRVERFVGTHHVPNFFRKPYGPGWTLVGDAGYHKDPVTALGIADAWRSVDLMATSLHEVLSGVKTPDEALGYYEKRRNELSEPFYWFSIEQAKYQPLDALKRLVLRALQHDDEERSRFFGVLAGSVAPDEFGSLTNVASLLIRHGLMPESRAFKG